MLSRESRRHMDTTQHQPISTCDYAFIAERIHCYTFLQPTRQAVDDFIAIMTDIAETHQVGPYDDIITLIDLSQSGLPPVNYLLTRIGAFQRKYPARGSGRVALINQHSGLSSLISSLAAVLARHARVQIRLFTPAERDEAIAWLLETHAT